MCISQNNDLYKITKRLGIGKGTLNQYELLRYLINSIHSYIININYIVNN